MLLLKVFAWSSLPLIVFLSGCGYLAERRGRKNWAVGLIFATGLVSLALIPTLIILFHLEGPDYGGSLIMGGVGIRLLMSPSWVPKEMVRRGWLEPPSKEEATEKLPRPHHRKSHPVNRFPWM